MDGCLRRTSMDIPGTDGRGGPTEAKVMVGGDEVSVSFDPGHLLAHADDFTLSWPEILDIIGVSLDSIDPRAGLVHAGFTQEDVVGMTGVTTLDSDDSPFWGYRPGRDVPSHLIVGTKVATREICVWGEWLSPDRFDLWTCYPGGPAPREIHDPDLALEDIDASIAFWSVHAIIIDGDAADSALTRSH
jgi:hypothetical protein